MPAVFLDEDLEWLRTQIPKEDSLAFKQTKVIPILNLIKHADSNSLPMSIGVFGSWGTGKTTMLAMLAEAINQDGVDGKFHPIVYFKAWKYAGFMEVVPALVYKILRAVNTTNDPSKWNLASRIMLSLGNRYVDQFGDWTEKRFGINISDLAQDALKIVFKDVKNPDVFHAIRSDNRFYSNIRILKKSWDHVIRNGSDEGHLWSKWHLELLKQGHLAVRKKVKKVAKDLASIAAASHLAMLGDLDRLNRIDWKSCLILMPGDLQTSKGNTAFAIYRSWFWDITKDRITWSENENTLESLDRAEVLKEFVTDHHLMEFFCIMSLIDFPLDMNVRNLCANAKGPFEFDPETIEGVSHYSWALANF